MYHDKRCGVFCLSNSVSIDSVLRTDIKLCANFQSHLHAIFKYTPSLSQCNKSEFSIFSGNVDGESPYRKGYPSCFESGLENSRKYAGLCGKAIFVSSPSTNGIHWIRVHPAVHLGNPNRVNRKSVIQMGSGVFLEASHRFRMGWIRRRFLQ